MKILLIDDDPYWSKGFHDFAALFEGWEVIYASSPQVGIELLKSNMSTLDAVLVDVMMTADDSVPEARDQLGINTGLLLLDLLLPFTKGRVPIILVTARQDIDEDVYEEKAEALIQKNLPTNRIIEEVKLIISS